MRPHFGDSTDGCQRGAPEHLTAARRGSTLPKLTWARDYIWPDDVADGLYLTVEATDKAGSQTTRRFHHRYTLSVPTSLDSADDSGIAGDNIAMLKRRAFTLNIEITVSAG